jgi:thiamine-monophosphate kinase
MEIQEWGEEELIRYISKEFPVSLPVIGIGDDCAVICKDDKDSWIVTTDALVEGVHFIRSQISPEDLGYKTVAVNVSDIAAMGGAPQYAFLTLALPRDIEESWLKEFIHGIKEGCLKWGLQLLGGDTVGSKRDVFINFTIIGVSEKDRVKYRSEAKANDVICVNGYLGDSAGGLKALQEELEKTEEVRYLINAHFRPTPSPEEAGWLASQKGVHAMMDLSDGLDCDLRRIIKASHIGAVINVERLPISEALSHVSFENHWEIDQLAIAGGEDYRLLITISNEVFDAIQALFREKFGHILYPIGYISDQETDLVYHKAGKPVGMNLKKFDHFQ